MKFMNKKKSKPQYYLSFLLNQAPVLKCKFIELPIKEEVIIKKSIVFFDDPEPCYIHKGAVTMRLIAEIQDSLENEIKHGVMMLCGDKIPSVVNDYVNIDFFDAIAISEE